MLNPEFLASLPEAILKLFYAAERQILVDMAWKIVKYDYYVPSAEYQHQKLREAGVMQEEILTALAKLTRRSEEELRQMMQEACGTSLRGDTAIYEAAGLTVPSIGDNGILRQILNAGYKATAQTMRNLCKTTARTAAQQFENALDGAWLKVHSGAFDSETAIRSAIKDLSQKGIQAIRYPSGRTDCLETAVRRAVVTGVNQTSAQLQEELADELDCDLVEVSAHAGARPEHAVWQGRIFSRSGTHPKYPDFRAATGYGRVDGLCGANCRHTFGPYIEGSPPVWSEEELKKLDDPKYEYNGQKLTEYEASQIQRNNERQIRRWQREYAAMDAAGLDTSEAAAKLKYWEETQADFLDKTGLTRQYEREQSTSITPKLSEKIEERVRYARASDIFTVVPPDNGDSIKPQSIYKGLQRSEIGKHVYEVIVSRDIPVLITYAEAENTWILGRTDGSFVEIFARNTKTRKSTISTIIHEITHIELNTDHPSQWEEAYCIAQERKHENGQLTFADLKDIIKTVRERYPELPWR